MRSRALPQWSACCGAPAGHAPSKQRPGMPCWPVAVMAKDARPTVEGSNQRGCRGWLVSSSSRNLHSLSLAHVHQMDISLQICRRCLGWVVKKFSRASFRQSNCLNGSTHSALSGHRSGQLPDTRVMMPSRGVSMCRYSTQCVPGRQRGRAAREREGGGGARGGTARGGSGLTCRVHLPPQPCEGAPKPTGACFIKGRVVCGGGASVGTFLVLPTR